ncbi:beta-glucosidase, partial [Pseudactinotalea sp.]|uniref:beta-glucosidase family protein n=1 Tax=Pseudactinotalea sp. TaxID=1926260 RepID=UPI003B3A88E5
MTPAAKADLLLSQLTLDEKVAMLHQWSPAIERVHLPTFRTGSEVLHGVAWLGEATVFPQPVGLAATWDPALAERIGSAVVDELLAKHAVDPSISLNVWAPVVDPLRHPLWGRNEEGFSEDPHLTADLATGYAQGLRGRGPGWRTVPTLKHLLAYNVETDRDVRSMQVRDRVLHEYELPAFAGPLRAGVAGAVMPAYNLVNGRPAHTSRDLIEAVRSFADGEILVVSDAGAPTNLVRSQGCYPDAAAAHAAALQAGIDSFTDNDRDAGPTIDAVRIALRDGLVTEADVDRAVKRLFITRARVDLLEADPPSVKPDLDSLLTAHADLAREAARRSVVLLVNDGVLPRSAPPRSVCVVGPLAERVLPDWYAGEPRHTASIAEAAAQRWPDAEITTLDGADHVLLQVPDGRVLTDAEGVAVRPVPSDAEVPSTLAITDWGWGLTTIADRESGKLWSVDDRGVVSASADRPHGWVVQQTFRIRRYDDGSCALRHVASGRWLRLDAADRLVAAAPEEDEALRLRVHTVQAGTAAVATAAAASDLVICALGNDPHLLGRETEDRPSLELPPSQQELWFAARREQPDAVLTLVSSYPYAFDLDARAVLWSGHSQAVGLGLIDVIAGDAEPSGRLPQTWWRSTSDAGALTDYDIVAGRSTYWYNDAEPLFAFGHGLTYTSVQYRSLEIVALEESGVRVVVVVSNGGDRPATEVVQVYTDALDHRVPFPRRLGGYARVPIQPGEHARVEVTVPRDRFAFWDTARGTLTVDPGRYLLSAGPSAADTPLHAEVDLAGEAPLPHRVPLRASAFDDLAHVQLIVETLERGTAVSGPGWVSFADVEGLAQPLVARVARTGPGTSRVELQSRSDAGWRTFATATLPTDPAADR